MKQKLFHGILAMMMLCVAMTLTACGGDDDDGGGGNSGVVDIEALVGRSFHKQETTYGGNVETKHTTIYFKNAYFAVVHIWGNGDDADGHYHWDHGEIDCTFTISGNKITIPVYERNELLETLVVEVRNNSLVGYSG